MTKLTSDLTTSKILGSSDSLCCFGFFPTAPVWRSWEKKMGLVLELMSVLILVLCGGVGVGVRCLVFRQDPSVTKTCCSLSCCFCVCATSPLPSSDDLCLFLVRLSSLSVPFLMTDSGNITRGILFALSISSIIY